jgi:fibronectin-binding autotransporter adhesin
LVLWGSLLKRGDVKMQTRTESRFASVLLLSANRSLQMKFKNGWSLACAVTLFILLVTPGTSRAETLLSDNFDSGSTANWTLSSASLYTGGTYATSTPNALKVGGSTTTSSYATLVTPLALVSKGYTSVTITFNIKVVGTGYNNFYVNYSANGGTSWTAYNPGHINGLATTTNITLTVSTGLSDNFLFQIQTAQNNPINNVYVDNVLITATPDFRPSYWDPSNGTSAGTGSSTPAGTWDASTANWNSIADGTGTPAAWGSGNGAVFAAGTDATGIYTVTVDGTQTIDGLSFLNGTVTLAAGTLPQLTLNTNASVGVTAGLTATIEVPLVDDGTARALKKTGTGTLILSGNNTTTAASTMSISAGTVRFDSPNAIYGTGRNVTVNAGTVAMFGPSFDTGSGEIAAALLNRIVAASAGTIAADNNATGAFNFSTAGLTAASLGAVGDVTYTGTLTPNGTVYRLGGGGGTLTMANTGALSGSRTLTVVSPGAVVLSAANSLTGATTINAGATLVVNNSASLNNKGISLFIGTLVLGSDIDVGSGNNQLYYGTGAKIRSDSTTARTITGALRGNANNTVILGDAVYNGKLTFITATQGSSSSDRYQCDSDVEFAGGMASGVLPVKSGTGTLTVSAASAYTGATTVSAGALRISHSTGLGTTAGGVTVASGAALELTNNITVGAEALSLAGSGISSGGALRNISGTNTYGGLITVASSTRISADSGSRLTLNVSSGSAITNAGTFSVAMAGAGEIIVADPINIGACNVNRLSSGTLELQAVNTYSGATMITNSTLTGVTGGSCDNSDVTVNANGKLGVRVSDPLKQWSCKSVTVNLATGTKLKFAFDVGGGSTSLAPMKILNNLTFTGVPEVVVDPTNLQKGFMYPLVEVVGTAPTDVPTLIGVDGKLLWQDNTLYLNWPKSGTVILLR